MAAPGPFCTKKEYLFKTVQLALELNGCPFKRVQLNGWVERLAQPWPQGWGKVGDIGFKGWEAHLHHAIYGLLVVEAHIDFHYLHLCPGRSKLEPAMTKGC